MSSVDDAIATMYAKLKEMTGKSIEEWMQIAQASGISKHMELVKWLQTEHGLTYGYANTIALRARDAATGAPTTDNDLLEAQYAGAKAVLRPWYDALAEKIQEFGSDVEFDPKKAYVSVRRKKQFAILQPSTAARLDIGINLKGTPPGARLEASGSFNSMVSHRVRVQSAAEIDDELVAWLRKAYDAA